MQYYLAPLEGITNSTVRLAFAHNFCGIDKYFTPFIPAGKKWNSKIKRDLNPENNRGITLVPQAISNNAEELPEFEKRLLDLGYEEYNLNMGCPSGTVVSKGRGSGFLKDVEGVNRFLDILFSATQMRVSVKTRIGFDDPKEWDDILKVYERFPIDELIIHPRLGSEKYKGSPRMECFKKAYEAFYSKGIKIKLCYNGDINSSEDAFDVSDSFPNVNSLMIGRGMLKKPWLIEEIKAGKTPIDIRDRLSGFHDEIYAGYNMIFSGDKDTLMHMKEIWSYLYESFLDGKKILKEIKKCNAPAEYKSIVNRAFASGIL